MIYQRVEFLTDLQTTPVDSSIIFLYVYISLSYTHNIHTHNHPGELQLQFSFIKNRFLVADTTEYSGRVCCCYAKMTPPGFRRHPCPSMDFHRRQRHGSRKSTGGFRRPRHAANILCAMRDVKHDGHVWAWRHRPQPVVARHFMLLIIWIFIGTSFYVFCRQRQSQSPSSGHPPVYGSVSLVCTTCCSSINEAEYL